MTESHYRCVLGFDHGYMNIGVAVGQMVTRTASPLSVLKAKRGQVHWPDVQKLIDQWHPDVIVVGVPRGSQGQDLSSTGPALRFIKILEKQSALPIFSIDETLSTREAYTQLEEMKGQPVGRQRVDSLSACLILETWMAQAL